MNIWYKYISSRTYCIYHNRAYTSPAIRRRYVNKRFVVYNSMIFSYSFLYLDFVSSNWFPSKRFPRPRQQCVAIFSLYRTELQNVDAYTLLCCVDRVELKKNSKSTLLYANSLLYFSKRMAAMEIRVSAVKRRVKIGLIFF